MLRYAILWPPQVHVTQAGMPLSSSTFAAASGLRLWCMCSSGTFRDGLPGLHDTGLTGECQVRRDSGVATSSSCFYTVCFILDTLHFVPGASRLGVATFSSLLFQHTSFNCGNRPFHLVVTVLASSSAGLPPAQRKAVALASVCSSPIHVDARKR